MRVYPKNSITTHVQKINVTHGPRVKETVKYSMNSVQTKHYKLGCNRRISNRGLPKLLTVSVDAIRLKPGIMKRPK